MKIRSRGMVIGVLAAALAGCGGEEEPPPAACPGQERIDGACAGVPAEPVCGSDVCTEGAACTQVIEVGDDADLVAALADAAPGSCIALKPGGYAAATLPGGVSLLGRSAAEVSVEGVVLQAGEGALVRGVSIGAGGVIVEEGVSSARLAWARVAGSQGDGITVQPGAAIAITDATIEGSTRIGLLAFDGADVRVERSVLAENAYAAVWAQASCDAGCACAAPTRLGLTASILRGNGAYGAVLFGTEARLSAVDIADTTGDLSQFNRGGSGLTATACSYVDAKGLRVLRNHDYGVLVERSRATLGDEDSTEDGVEIRENTVGLWVNASPGQRVELSNAIVDKNLGVGIGVAGDLGGGTQGQDRAFVICRSRVTSTLRGLLPTFGAEPGAQLSEIGYGMTWLNAGLDVGEADPPAPVTVTVNGLTLRDNADASLLIDGATTGQLLGISLEGSDAEVGILQQNLANAAHITPPKGVRFVANNVREMNVPGRINAPPPGG